MEVNVGERDRLLRLIFGVYAMLMGFLFIQGVIGTLLGIVGVVLLVTGLARRCGIYELLGISTVSEAALSEEVAAETVEADEIHERDEA
jgi:hypothetical protein